MTAHRINGIALRAAGGAGSPVLLLHGIGGSSASFATQVPGLAAAHRVLAWDAPGYGHSADPAPDLGMAGYATAAAGLLRTLGAAPAHVVGVSFGGVVATRLALDHPEAVRSLVLVDSTRGAGTGPDAAARMRARVADLAEHGATAFARRRAPRLVGPGADPAVLERITATMAAVRPAGYAAAAEAMATTDHTGELVRVGVPTLVLVGADDRVTGVAESRALADGVPGARFGLLGGGHAAHQERPDGFTAAVLGFLAEVDAAVPLGGAR